ncbi:MAG: hypothetical protein IJA69_03840 [Clostridia bacterium]|nr:hypothetical protein [Clostridia bacterium]
MSALSSWVLSIVGVSVLSVLIDLFMPDGETNSHIKSVFNFVIILVIILPLPNLFNKEIQVEDFIAKEEIVLQNDYIYQINKDRLIELENQIEKDLNSRGLEQIDVIISADIFTMDMQIMAVFVELKNMVILENSQHIDIEKEVISCVQSVIDIEKENIFINE